MVDFNILSASIIFFVGFVSNFIGTTIGGSALLTVPTCILLGFSPQVAVATTRFGGVKF